MDGVIINEFYDNIILGSGDFDPPEGWIDFSTEKATGNKQHKRQLTQIAVAQLFNTN